MDIGALGQDASLEAARELLIAITYSKPDRVLNPVAAENFSSRTGAVMLNADRADELRSKLISISYLQSAESGFMKCNGHA